jgi:hypothetical protein
MCIFECVCFEAVFSSWFLRRMVYRHFDLSWMKHNVLIYFPQGISFLELHH